MDFKFKKIKESDIFKKSFVFGVMTVSLFSASCFKEVCYIIKGIPDLPAEKDASITYQNQNLYPYNISGFSASTVTTFS